MKMPDRMPARPRLTDQPAYGFDTSVDQVKAQQFFPSPGQIACAACCVGKAGYAACLARCLADGKCCDGGINNCS